MNANPELDALLGRHAGVALDESGCRSTAQRTASTTLRNSMIEPSPVRLTTRPWCTEMIGSIRSLRSVRSRASVRSSSAPVALRSRSGRVGARERLPRLVGGCAGRRRSRPCEQPGPKQRKRHPAWMQTGPPCAAGRPWSRRSFARCPRSGLAFRCGPSWGRAEKIRASQRGLRRCGARPACGRSSCSIKSLAGYIVEATPETGEKADRARPFAAQVNRGLVTMIDADWNAAYREELRAFPNGKFKDQVDASSRTFMALVEGYRKPLVFTREQLDAIGPPSLQLSPFGRRMARREGKRHVYLRRVNRIEQPQDARQAPPGPCGTPAEDQKPASGLPWPARGQPGEGIRWQARGAVMGHHRHGSSALRGSALALARIPSAKAPCQQFKELRGCSIPLEILSLDTLHRDLGFRDQPFLFDATPTPFRRGSETEDFDPPGLRPSRAFGEDAPTSFPVCS